MIEFVMKYYRTIVLGIVVAVSVIVIQRLEGDIEDLKIDLILSESRTSEALVQLHEKKTLIATQNILILANKTEYEENMKRLPMQIETIKTKYVAVYTDIRKWEKDSNASDCNGAVTKLNTFNF